jgi:AbrB family looped-hinge helix DNA binding protein
MKSRISSKGQITVPVQVRDELGLAAGTEVEFIVRDGEAVLRKGGGPTHPVDRVYGRLRLGKPVDAILDAMRGPRPKIARRRGRRT